MPVIAILILVSLSLALAFLAAFIWAVRSGQFEDTFTPSLRVLTEEEPAKPRPQSERIEEIKQNRTKPK